MQQGFFGGALPPNAPRGYGPVRSPSLLSLQIDAEPSASITGNERKRVFTEVRQTRATNLGSFVGRWRHSDEVSAHGFQELVLLTNGKAGKDGGKRRRHGRRLHSHRFGRGRLGGRGSPHYRRRCLCKS